MGVTARSMAKELLTRSQLYRTVGAEGVALLADDHVGGAAAVKILADAQGDFVGDSRSQSLTNVDMLAGDLDLHAVTTRLSRDGVKRP